MSEQEHNEQSGHTLSGGRFMCQFAQRGSTHPPALEVISAGGHHALGRNTAMFSTSWPTMSSAPTGKDVVTQMKCP